MNLYEKIKSIYPNLESKDFDPIEGTILLLNDCTTGFTDKIAKWEHPTLARPTDEELA